MVCICLLPALFEKILASKLKAFKTMVRTRTVGGLYVDTIWQAWSILCVDTGQYVLVGMSCADST